MKIEVNGKQFDRPQLVAEIAKREVETQRFRDALYQLGNLEAAEALEKAKGATTPPPK